MERELKSLIYIILCFIIILLPLSAAAAESKNVKPTPEKVIKMLQEGNKRYYSGKPAYPHTGPKRFKLAGEEDQGNHAYATILSCSDSRVPVELIFDAGVMDIFVIRVAGNVCNTDEIGSIEYGLAHVHTPVLVILGHTQCGAVNAVTHAVQGKGQKLEKNIPPLVQNITPAVKRAMAKHEDVHGDDIIPHAIEENIWQGINDLFMKSAAVRNIVKAGEAMVVGAVYDVGTGKVKWLSKEKVIEILDKVEESPEKETEVYAAQ